MSNRLAGKVAVVTGARSSIGAASAQALLTEGARVMLADLAVADPAGLAASMSAPGADPAVAMDCNVADEEDVRRLIDRTMDRFGRLDIVFNNAAATHLAAHDGDVTTADVQSWDAAMAVNVRGAMLTSKHAVAHMVTGGGGSIINTASTSGLQGDIGIVAYTTSKAALLGLTRSIAVSFASAGVRCNALALGPIATPQMLAAPPAFQERLIAGIPVGRLGRPADVAALVVYLASDESAFMTGQTLVLDGGSTVMAPWLAAASGPMWGGAHRD